MILFISMYKAVKVYCWCRVRAPVHFYAGYIFFYVETPSLKNSC